MKHMNVGQICCCQHLQMIAGLVQEVARLGFKHACRGLTKCQPCYCIWQCLAAEQLSALTRVVHHPAARRLVLAAACCSPAAV
jgi:hypothetical protein